MKIFTRDDTEHGKEYYLVSEVAQCLCKDKCLHMGMYQCKGLPSALAVTSPAAQRKPLTVEEIWSAIRPLTRSDEVCKALVHVSMDEYRAIEAAHGIKEKNT
jgi:hypothetical protein